METTLATRDSASSVLDFKYFYYEPSMAAAVIFIILFAIATTLHFYQMFRTRTWFLIPFVIGAVLETIGYIGRAILSAETGPDYSLGPYIIQSVFLLVSPALFAASIYMELGRIVLMVNGEKALFIRRTWLTKIFVTGDVFAFMLQAGGAGLLSSQDAGMIKTGQNVVVGGLFAQVVFFGLFVIAAAIFHVSISKNPTQLSYERPWKRHMWGLYIVSILIFVRSIVRVVEFLEGKKRLST